MRRYRSIAWTFSIFDTVTVAEGISLSVSVYLSVFDPITTADAGDLTPWGTYQVQAKLTMPGFTGRGKRATFEVLKNL